MLLQVEDAEHGVLDQQGRVMVNGEECVLPWSVRMKIGKEIANAVTYLHMAFPKIIIHRDVRPTVVFLDKNWTAKLTNFSLSVTLPEGKSSIEVEGEGTSAYLPLIRNSNLATEYTDVYSFGISLLNVLTGRPAYSFTGPDGIPVCITDYAKGLYENGKLDEVIDPIMSKEEDITSAQRLQLQACVVLALSCCKENDEDKPKMLQIAKELKRIESSLRDPL